jgi:hypothetical protein
MYVIQKAANCRETDRHLKTYRHEHTNAQIGRLKTIRHRGIIHAHRHVALKPGRRTDRQRHTQTCIKRHTGRETHRQAERNTDRQADAQTGRRTDRYKHIQAERHTDMYKKTYRQRDTQTGRETHRRAERHTDSGEAHRQAERQTDKYYIKTYKHVERRRIMPRK